MKYHVEKYKEPVKENWDNDTFNDMSHDFFDTFRSSSIFRMEKILEAQGKHDFICRICGKGFNNVKYIDSMTKGAA